MTSSGDGGWYRRAFAGEYLDVYRHRSHTAARLEMAALFGVLKEPSAARILDLCCGAGRHSAALRQQGFTPFGMDLSPELLAESHPTPAHPCRVARGDMRALPFRANSLDLVLQLFTSFGYFETDAENRTVLSEVLRTLRPGGRHVLDLMNRERTLAALVPRSIDERDGRRLEQRRRFRSDVERVEKTVEITEPSGDVVTWTESVRVFRPDEISRWLTEAGGVVVDVLGSFAGAAFDQHMSERMIIVTRAA